MIGRKSSQINSQGYNMFNILSENDGYLIQMVCV